MQNPANLKGKRINVSFISLKNINYSYRYNATRYGSYEIQPVPTYRVLTSVVPNLVKRFLTRRTEYDKEQTGIRVDESGHSQQPTGD